MKPLVFQAIDWYITDFDDENDDDSDNNNSINKKYLIKIFGRTQKGNAISLNITDYTPYFYIKGLDNFPEQKHRSILLRLQDYIDENTLTYVAVHELAHVATKEIGHVPVFWENFKWMLNIAKDKGIYNYVNYKENPQPYCGLLISNNILDN